MEDKDIDILFGLFVSLGVSTSIAKVASFFIYETVYLSVLLALGIFAFTFIRVKFLNDDLVRKLESKPKVFVYLGMALLGIISPFCSCSTIPVFVSFAALGVPTGALFVFLITSPLVQETSIIILLAEFGVSVTALYILFGVVSGIIIGIILSAAKDKDLFTAEVMEKREQKELFSDNKESCGCGSADISDYTGECCPDNKASCCDKDDSAGKTDSCCSDNKASCCDKDDAGEKNGSCCSDNKVSCCDKDDSVEKTGSCCSGTEKAIDPRKNPVLYSRIEAFKTLKSTYKYILIGIAFGAFVYGIVPPAAIEQLLGASNSFAPILATLVGIPIYADDVALIPIAKTLINSGAGLGTALSFVMSSAVVSIPSFIMLASVLRKKTIIKLLIILTVTIIIIGYTFNILQPFIM